MRAIITLSIAMLVSALAVSACGGGDTGLLDIGGGSSSSSAANVADVVVDSGPDSNCQANNDCVINVLYTTVTICAPGSSTNCQTIDHVQVDTGSYGLRILASALQPSLASALPAVKESTSNEPLAECVQFADGYSWGPVKTADLQIAGEAASGIEVHIIGDPTYSTVPSDCQNTSGITLAQEDTVSTFGANGIIGVGPFVQDCGPGCTPVQGQTQSGFTGYYVCSTPASCADSAVSLEQQVSNPVASFPVDNNGVVIELPSIPAGGQASVTGSLIFGIGTQSNNQLGSATVLAIPGSSAPACINDGTCGVMTTEYKGVSLPQSYIDSGSNGYFFQDSSITPCSGGNANSAPFYCPASTLTETATNQGTTGTMSTVTFSVANADDLNGAYFAFDDLAGALLPTQTGSQGGSSQNVTFDWGLSFFFGRNVYTAIDGMNTPAGLGPYFAY